MKKYIYIMLMVLPALFITNFAWRNLDNVSTRIIKPTSGFAVVEVFTSEGCGSCPPAYEVIEKLQKEAEENRKDVFILDFHVDHWDHLGWKDPFSSVEYSDRQLVYSRYMGPDYLYTPQMIINGQAEFSAAKEDRAKQEVLYALSQNVPADLKIKVKPVQAKDSITVDYETNDVNGNAIFNIALTENVLTNNVLGGDNAGKTLKHHNVVRKFVSVKLKTNKGTIKIPSPENYSGNGYKVTGFLQLDNSMRIIAADAVNLELKAHISKL